MYDNEFETKENKIWTKDKIDPQHIHHLSEVNCLPKLEREKERKNNALLSFTDRKIVSVWI